MSSLKEAIIISAHLSEIPNRASSCLIQGEFSTPISLQAGVTRLVLLEGVEVFASDSKHEEAVIVGGNQWIPGLCWPIWNHKDTCGLFLSDILDSL